MCEYTVIGTFRKPHKDCEGESMTVNSYNEALKVCSAWKNSKKYKEVFIDKFVYFD